MDFEEQSKFANELDNFLLCKLKGKRFHVIIGVGNNYDDGFSYNVSTLSKETPFEACDMIVTAITAESKTLLKQFKIPSDRKLKKPVERK